jgi:proline iminopeptidase
MLGSYPSRASSGALVREGYLPVPGAQLYFREIGDGPPLVLLHGGPDFNHNYLLPEMDRLSSEFRLIYYDQRGRGRSSGGVVPEDVTIDSEVDDLDRLRQYFDLGTIAVLGHSWGGVLAMEFATRHSDRVTHLMLMNTAPASHADLLRFREQRQREEKSSLARMGAISRTPGFAQGDIQTEAEYYRIHFGATVRRSDQLESVLGRLRADFTPEDILKARAIEHRLYAETWLAEGYDLIPRLRKLRTPTLVIHGDYDLFPLQCARNVADSMAASRLVVLNDCGHFAYVESPAEVQRVIVEFVSQS